MVALLVLLVGACLLIGSSAPEPASAQLQPSADGASLERKARNALQALVSLSPESIWNEIAPWHQNGIRLHKARLEKALEREDLAWAMFKGTVEEQDPTNRLNIGSAEDFAALSNSDFFGLFSGLYAHGSDKDISAAMGAEWFLTLRSVGLGQTQSGNSRDFLLQTVGIVRFETVDGAEVVVNCVAEGREWFVAGMAWEVASASGDTQKALTSAGMLAKRFLPKPGPTQKAEGEQLAGSMKNRARVYFAKYGEVPKKLVGPMSEGGCGVEKQELEGRYYTVDDTLRGTKEFGIVVARAAGKPDGACLFLAFDCTSGESLLEHFNGSAAMLKRMGELEAKNPFKKDTTGK
jgi:hypothetical protein